MNTPDSDTHGRQIPLVDPWLADPEIPHMPCSTLHAVDCERTCRLRCGPCMVSSYPHMQRWGVYVLTLGADRGSRSPPEATDMYRRTGQS